MENSHSNKINPPDDFIDITRLGSGEARDYIAEMLATDNLDALQASLNKVKGRYESMHDRVGGEYEYQFYIYLIGELS